MALPLGIPQIIMAVAAVLCIIELGLTGGVASLLDNWSPSSINFGIFCSVWSLLVLAYLAIAPMVAPKLVHRFVVLGLLAVTTIFWFSGAIAMAAWIGGFRCRGVSACHTAKAAAAFGFFVWAAFTSLLTLEIMNFLRGRSAGIADGGGVPMGAPKPSQPAGQTYPGV